ncbi:MAG: DNA mismatch repair protein MutS, partial [Clostridiales bacterium]|nr:DNA mismatch repair protein MutS [Clostridiales bacterium]
LCVRIETALKEEQPLSVREGNIIKSGYSEALDGIGAGLTDGQGRIAQLEAKERERTGIRSLKIRYNRLQGYTIEVTAANLGLVPEDYQRKATLANAERFVTQELKDVEHAVLTAGERRSALEYELFVELRDCALARIEQIRATAAALAQIDVLQGFAEAAQAYAYTRPQVEDSDRLFIVGGRHPVLERSIEKRRGAGNIVKNDLSMNLSDESLLLVTGPNMGGKSTYMRQAALIVLMAQIGSFVPADEAKIGLVDRIFTRIGASDNLAREQSTFLVEMNELSDILRNYTEKSLILLDEIGRGTSTYDGLAIAWAACDWLCESGRRARCLFATHYHELTALEGRLPGLKNLSTAVDESGDRVVYLHKIRAGASSRSYGIHVAEMAGLPASLTEDAREKLALLEAEAKDVRAAAPRQGSGQISFLTEDRSNLNLENDRANLKEEPAEGIIRLLADTQVMDLTPAAAIALVERLKNAAEGRENTEGMAYTKGAEGTEGTKAK